MCWSCFQVSITVAVFSCRFYYLFSVPLTVRSAMNKPKSSQAIQSVISLTQILRAPILSSRKAPTRGLLATSPTVYWQAAHPPVPTTMMRQSEAQVLLGENTMARRERLAPIFTSLPNSHQRHTAIFSTSDQNRLLRTICQWLSVGFRSIALIREESTFSTVTT